jgi:hypothetical protein
MDERVPRIRKRGSTIRSLQSSSSPQQNLAVRIHNIKVKGDRLVVATTLLERVKEIERSGVVV